MIMKANKRGVGSTKGVHGSKGGKSADQSSPQILPFLQGMTSYPSLLSNYCPTSPSISHPHTHTQANATSYTPAPYISQ